MRPAARSVGMDRLYAHFLPLEQAPGSGSTMKTNDHCPRPSASCDVDERFSVTLLPPVLVLTWTPCLLIDERDVLLATAAVCASGGGDLPLLVELSQPREITWDARKAVLDLPHRSRVALLGADDVDLVLTAFTVRSSADIRFFTDRDEAELWLLQG